MRILLVSSTKLVITNHKTFTPHENTPDIVNSVRDSNNPLSLSNIEGISEQQHKTSAHEGWAAYGQTKEMT